MSCGGFDYDEKAAARILNVAPRTLRRWRIDGKVSHHRTPGGRVRYSTDQLLELQLAGRVAATAARGG
jgi:excisionase family DNA binding protein